VALAATGVFLTLDAVLVVSCSLKFLEGGWFPLVTGALIFTLMATWRHGRELLIENIRQDDPELLPFITALAAEKMHRVSRTAIYAVANPDTVPQALELCQAQGLAVNLFETSYFLSREIVVPTKGAGMAHWREALFAIMSRNAGSVAAFFQLPNNCVIELGTRVQI
jgi:K+ transporter